MKSFFKTVESIALCAVLVVGLSSCERKSSSDGDQYGDYHAGYVDGYGEGFVEGQKELGGYARVCFDDACGYTYGIEEALTTLTLYADGETFSEEEIFSAIQTVTSFYDDVCDVIHKVEYYYD